jgi:hypothetical protein
MIYVLYGVEYLASLYDEETYVQTDVCERSSEEYTKFGPKKEEDTRRQRKIFVHNVKLHNSQY